MYAPSLQPAAPPAWRYLEVRHGGRIDQQPFRQENENEDENEHDKRSDSIMAVL